MMLVQTFSDVIDVEAESEEHAQQIAMERSEQLEFQDLESSIASVASVEPPQ
jgi:hypothetical protein